jgi:hypothetical protein
MAVLLSNIWGLRECRSSISYRGGVSEVDEAAEIPWFSLQSNHHSSDQEAICQFFVPGWW